MVTSWGKRHGRRQARRHEGTEARRAPRFGYGPAALRAYVPSCLRAYPCPSRMCSIFLRLLRRPRRRRRLVRDPVHRAALHRRAVAGLGAAEALDVRDQLDELLLAELLAEAGHDRLVAGHDLGAGVDDRLAQV